MSNNAKATARYIELVASIKESLAKLQAASDEHFYADADNIHWGHVGTLASIDNDIKSICDRVFHEGEYAN